MFSLFIMPKRRTFGNFSASSEDNFFFGQKGGHVLQKEDVWVNPHLGILGKNGGSAVSTDSCNSDVIA